MRFFVGFTARIARGLFGAFRRFGGAYLNKSASLFNFKNSVNLS